MGEAAQYLANDDVVNRDRRHPVLSMVRWTRLWNHMLQALSSKAALTAVMEIRPGAMKTG
jgi:hypothetical protein